MKRVFLFLVTNIAVLVVLSVVLQILGVDRILDEQGSDLDLGALLIFSAAFGISGGMAQGFKRLFLSHPPLSERIAALESLSG